ncbi:MAG: hypothetical protein HUK40_13225 [Desulfobacter sp.]|nr:hypothetical protein [Desulfobacter sp.]WDP83763.1 MAG: hypothetical protein HUN05_00085 [Desulfobacter sp.]
MKLIIYTKDKDSLGKKLGKMIHQQLPEVQIETIDSAGHLSQILCRPLNRISVIIFFTACKKDIHDLLGLKPLFDNTRRILVLPDEAKGMMAFGLQLNPSFISSQDSDFLDIISVLKKIYQNTREAFSWQAGFKIEQNRGQLKFKDEKK